MGFVHHLGKFIPNLSQLCHVFQPLPKKDTNFVWTDEHEQHFNIIRAKTAEEVTENKHFNPDLETRIKSNASRKSFGLRPRTANSR